MTLEHDADGCVRIAAIDLGTVSSRLSLARLHDGVIVDARKHSVITDMGKDVDATGRFRADAIDRVADACRTFVQEAEEFGAVATCVTLTSAARDAENSEELLGRLRTLGLEPQVIPGEVEGRLTFYGVAHDFPGERIAVADPGGGSTEIVVGTYDPAVPSIDVEHVQSLNIGCRRLTDRFFTADPPAQDEIDVAAAWSHEQFASYWDTFADRPDRFISVGGTVTTLVSLTYELEPYDSSFVHLRDLSLAEIEEQLRRMSALTVEEIRHLKGIQPQRAPMMLAGSIIMRELMRAGGYQTLTVSESSLLAGMVATIDETLQGKEPVVGWTPCLSYQA